MTLKRLCAARAWSEALLELNGALAVSSAVMPGTLFFVFGVAKAMAVRDGPAHGGNP